MKPTREPARNNQQTYFVSFQSANRTPLFRHERWLRLFLETLSRYGSEFALHDYVVMEDHVHLLITPVGPLERSVQLVKGGFSFQAKRQFEWRGEVWQRGFTDHRIRDAQDFQTHLRYLRQNLNSLPEALRSQYGRSGEHLNLATLPVPQRLKPAATNSDIGPTQVGPLQNDATAIAGVSITS